MINYMRAEFYKLLHRKYTYLVALVMLAGAGALVTLLVYSNSRGNTAGFATGAGLLTLLLSVGLYITVVIGDMVFSEQYKHNTLKNEVSYGVSRLRIYFGKLIVSCVAALVLCAVVVGVYLGLCWLFLPHQAAADAATMEMIGYCLLVALPLWLGAMAAANASYFLIKSSNMASFLVIGIVAVLPSVFQLMGALVHEVFNGLYRVMLSVPIDAASNMVGDWGFAGQAALIGLGWFVLSTVLGAVIFRKREIS